jgi:hypothetical protein
MAKIWILPYSNVSQGAKRLAKALDVKRLFDYRYKYLKAFDVVVNWGNGQAPLMGISPLKLKVLNPFERVSVSVNKLSTFNRLKEAGVRIPEFTTSVDTATQWLNKGATVVCRQKLTGTRGEGIIIASPEQPKIPQHVKLFTKYKKKKAEFRVHVFRGEVIDFQQKKRRKDYEGKADPFIRSEERGWVFCREGVVLPEDAKKQAVDAVMALGLDFGGVDVIWNEQEGRSYVLEINTAPGIEGQTVESYRKAVAKFVKQL